MVWFGRWRLKRQLRMLAMAALHGDQKLHAQVDFAPFCPSFFDTAEKVKRVKDEFEAIILRYSRLAGRPFYVEDATPESFGAHGEGFVVFIRIIGPYGPYKDVAFGGSLGGALVRQSCGI